MGRRGLSVVYGRSDAAVAFQSGDGSGGGRQRDDACAGVLAGRPDQRAQSEGGAVFSGVPAAICGGGVCPQDAGLPGAGSDLHLHRHAVVPRPRRLRGQGRQPHPAIGRCDGLDQPAARRDVRLSRDPRRDAGGTPPVRDPSRVQPLAARWNFDKLKRLWRDRARGRSSRSGTSGGRLPAASASAPPVR